jgi:hypothetical protein
MTTATQTPLPIEVPGLVPLAGIEDARRMLAPFGYNEDDIRAELGTEGTGDIEWAFNISSGSEVKEVRIYFPCLEQRVSKLRNPKWRMRSFSFDDVLRSLFPTRHRKPWVTTPAVARAFNCESDTVIKLVRCFRSGTPESGLQLLPNTVIHAGGHNGHGAAVILWESVKEFLSKRRI